MTATIETTCHCGRPMVRAAATGRWAEFLNGLPNLCERCEEQDRRDEALEARRAMRERERRRQGESGVPPHMRRDLGELDSEGRDAALDLCCAWADGKLNGVVLTGPVGTGKTTIACAAATELAKLRRVVFRSAPLLFAQLGSGLRSDAHDEAVAIVAGATALVLDDIDKSRPTPYGSEVIFSAVDTRILRKVPLLVTTNLDAPGLAAHFAEPFGDALASRLAGECSWATVGGLDRRLA